MSQATPIGQWEMRTLYIHQPGYGASEYAGQISLENKMGESIQFAVPPVALQQILDIVSKHVTGSSPSLGNALQCGPLKAKGLPELTEHIEIEDPAARASGVEEKSLNPVDDLPF